MSEHLKEVFYKADEPIVGVTENKIVYVNKAASLFTVGENALYADLKKIVEADKVGFYIYLGSSSSGRRCDLTKLPVGRQAMDAWANGKKTYAVLFIDLDGFKQVNDCQGHAAGDEVLISVAEGLKNLIRAEDAAIRLGGDEFLIAMSGDETIIKTAANGVGARVVQYVKNLSAGVTASIGIAFYPEHGAMPAEVVAAADGAMYEVKRKGKDGVVTANDYLSTADMEQGLKRGEFFILYQPQLEFAEGSWGIFGVEALLRWKHPVFGIIPPARFIGLAEKTPKFCKNLHLWVFSQVIKETENWAKAGLSLKVSFNLSSVAIQEDLMNHLVSVVLEKRLSNIQIELTESVAASARVIGMLDTVRSVFSVALDDFGQGYSGLSTVVDLKPDLIKLDRQNSANSTFVEMAVLVASSIGAKILAEGVEHEAQAEELLKAGVSLQQGYHFSWPLWPADVLEYARTMK